MWCIKSIKGYTPPDGTSKLVNYPSWVILQPVKEWWVARSWIFQILPARSWIFQILLAGFWIFQMLPARYWIFQILSARFGIILIMPARSMNFSNFANLAGETSLEYSKFCRQNFKFSKSCRTLVNLVIFKIFIAMSNCLRAVLRAASSSTNSTKKPNLNLNTNWPFNHFKWINEDFSEVRISCIICFQCFCREFLALSAKKQSIL